MASPARLLLRLPFSLRQHVLADRSTLRFDGHIRTYAQRGKKLPPPAKPLKTFTPPVESPALQSKPVFPSPPKPGRTSSSAIPGETQTTNANKNIVLLYTAPRHGIFYAISYLAGSFFIFGAYTYAELMLKDAPDGTKQPYWKKAIGAVSALAAASFGTIFILGPFGLIKSISVVSSEAGFANATTKFTRAPRTLRIEVKRKLPFLKPDILETDLANVSLDRRVPAALQDLRYFIIPRSYSESWTADYLAGRAEPTRSGSVTAAVRGLWPAILREVKRMFLRDQLAYVQVKDTGNFKLDLQGCRMLEGGEALDRVLPDNEQVDRSIKRWFYNLIGG